MMNLSRLLIFDEQMVKKMEIRPKNATCSD